MEQQIILKPDIGVTRQLVMVSIALRASAQEFDELLERELVENPALEIGESRSKAISHSVRVPTRPSGDGTFSSSRPSTSRRTSDDSYDPFDHVSARESVTDQLVGQAGLVLSGKDYEIAVHILHSLDEHGFLDSSCEQYAEELNAPCGQIERVIRVIQEMAFPGIAAHDIRECLLIQCKQLQEQGKDCEGAPLILERAWPDFLNHRWERVMRKLHISRRDIEIASRFMSRNLHPYPLQMMQTRDGDPQTFSRADLIVHREGADLMLEIPDADLFELRISPVFQRAFLELANCDRAQREWVNDSVARARMFIEAVRQRWKTLRRIGEFLLVHQRDFFDHGVRHLKPLTRCQLSVELDVHESTISRAIADKTIQLPNRRIISLSDLFDNSLRAKDVIRQVLHETNGKLSDREIAIRLHDEGFKLARRTVTKYRLDLGIPSRPLRRRAASNMRSQAA
jgi:RNA polymerase sigma-54 factor